MARSHPRVLPIVALALLIAAPAALADPAKPTTQQAYKMTIASQTVVDAEGKPKQDLLADMTLEYAWQAPTPLERVLVFKSMMIKLITNGKPVMDMSMDGQKLVRIADGERHEYRADNVPDEAKAMFRAAFGAPLYKVESDATGRDVRRTMLASPAAIRAMGDDGLILGALLFHPEPPVGRDQWETAAEVHGATGRPFKGRLTYKKGAIGKDGQTYAVSGTLTSPAPATASVKKDSSCIVTGEQTYDPATREWTGGRLTMDLSIDVVEGQKSVGTLKGPMVMTVESARQEK